MSDDEKHASQTPKPPESAQEAKQTQEALEDCLDEMSEESFPASDPPALGGGSAGSPRRTGSPKP